MRFPASALLLAQNIFGIFHFKQFSLYQHYSPLKVGTDGVLLGAWIGLSQARRILDVGTGTGLIALMLAQRNPEAIVEAIELNASACMQARQNFEHSPYRDHLLLHYGSVQEFALHHKQEFDTLVCNPPFFEKHYLSKDEDRNQARHMGSLSLSDLLSAASLLLQDKGALSLILPADQCPDQEYFAKSGFYPSRCTEVRSLHTKPVFRILLELKRHPVACKQDSLVIQNSTRRHDYTAEFEDLVRDFYLFI